MIPVTNNGYLRAPEPEDLPWLYRIENDASLWYLGTAFESVSEAFLFGQFA